MGRLNSRFSQALQRWVACDAERRLAARSHERCCMGNADGHGCVPAGRNAELLNATQPFCHRRHHSGSAQPVGLTRVGRHAARIANDGYKRLSSHEPGRNRGGGHERLWRAALLLQPEATQVSSTVSDSCASVRGTSIVFNAMQNAICLRSVYDCDSRCAFHGKV